MSQKIRILVAEDHLIARVGVIAILNMQPDMEVVAEAVNGREAVEQFRACRPDIALLDMRMPALSGIEAAAAIRAEFPEARLIALTTYGGDGDVRRALAAGVASYLTKDVQHTELLDAIRAVHRGEHYLPAAIQALLDAHGSERELSPREMDVLRLIVKGLPNKEIAWQLGIAEETAKNHVKKILFKLNAMDRTQAATMAISRGLVDR